MTGTSRFVFYSAIASLFFLTIFHTPFPNFRGISFEYLRDHGVYVLMVWGLVLICATFALFFLRRKREATLLLLVSLFSIVILLNPLIPFYSPQFVAIFSELHSLEEERGIETRKELLLLHSKTRSQALEAEVVGSEKDYVWLVKEDDLSAWTGGEGGCVRRFPYPGTSRSMLYTSYSCERISEMPLREGGNIALQVSTSLSDGEEQLPLYIFQMKEGVGKETLYQNMLSVRRLTGVVKQLPNSVVMYHGEVTPWSNLYWILSDGGELFDIEWGRSQLLLARELFSQQLSKIRSVLFKGNILPRSYEYIVNKEGSRTGYRAVLLIPN